LRQSFFWQWLLYRDKGIEPNKKPSGIDHGDQWRLRRTACRTNADKERTGNRYAGIAQSRHGRHRDSMWWSTAWNDRLDSAGRRFSRWSHAPRLSQSWILGGRSASAGF